MRAWTVKEPSEPKESHEILEEKMELTSTKLSSPPPPQKEETSQTAGASARALRTKNQVLNPICDIEGVECKEAPTFRRPSAIGPSRCPAHKLDGMLAVKKPQQQKPKQFSGLSSMSNPVASATVPPCKFTKCTLPATHTLPTIVDEIPVYCEEHAKSKSKDAYRAPNSKPF